MTKVKRAASLFVLLDDQSAVSMSSLLAAQMEKRQANRLTIFNPATGAKVECAPNTLQILTAMPANVWISEEQTRLRFDENSRVFDTLLDSGILISDDEAPCANKHRERDVYLRSSGWDVQSLLRFATSRWDKVMQLAVKKGNASERTRETHQALTQQRKKHGHPPSAFHPRCTDKNLLTLPDADYQSSLTHTLHKRETVRLFDEESPLQKEDLSTLLKFAAGFQGSSGAEDEMTLLKKFNPSGGALHSIEVYPFVLNVNGLEPGFYHYQVSDHALQPLKLMTKAQAQKAVLTYLAGQNWYQSAHVVLFLTARFERSFWKYRNHSKALQSIYVDAGHISQTIYLLSTEMKLGSFVTLAMNDKTIEKELGLDYVREGLIAACGFGVRKKNKNSDSYTFKYS